MTFHCFLHVEGPLSLPHIRPICHHYELGPFAISTKELSATLQCPTLPSHIGGPLSLPRIRSIYHRYELRAFVISTEEVSVILQRSTLPSSWGSPLPLSHIMSICHRYELDPLTSLQRSYLKQSYLPKGDTKTHTYYNMVIPNNPNS